MNAYTCSLGESGLVYKAYLDTTVGKELVAVKTVKCGTPQYCHSILAFFLHMESANIISIKLLAYFSYIELWHFTLSSSILKE